MFRFSCNYLALFLTLIRTLQHRHSRSAGTRSAEHLLVSIWQEHRYFSLSVTIQLFCFLTLIHTSGWGIFHKCWYKICRAFAGLDLTRAEMFQFIYNYSAFFFFWHWYILYSRGIFDKCLHKICRALAGLDLMRAVMLHCSRNAAAFLRWVHSAQ